MGAAGQTGALSGLHDDRRKPLDSPNMPSFLWPGIWKHFHMFTRPTRTGALTVFAERKVRRSAWCTPVIDPGLPRPFRMPAIHTVAPAGAASAVFLMLGLPGRLGTKHNRCGHKVRVNPTWSSFGLASGA